MMSTYRIKLNKMKRCKSKSSKTKQKGKKYWPKLNREPGLEDRFVRQPGEKTMTLEDMGQLSLDYVFRAVVLGCVID